MVLTDQDLQDLLRLPKQIVEKTPVRGYRNEGGHKRCDLKLAAQDDETGIFSVFVRQSTQFIENFSLGLKFRPNDRRTQEFVIIRYNGPHGEVSRHQDGHYDKPHIHRITATEISSGSTQPRAKQREITDRYQTYEQAIGAFFEEVSVENYGQYFPESSQGRLL